MSCAAEIHQILKLVRTYRQISDRKRQLKARLRALRYQNRQLEVELEETRKQVESFEKNQIHDDRASYIQLVQSREKILHMRHQLKEKSKNQHKAIQELEPEFERLQLSTFPVFT